MTNPTFSAAIYSLYGLREDASRDIALSFKRKIQKHMHSRRSVYRLKGIPVEYWFLEAKQELANQSQSQNRRQTITEENGRHQKKV